MPPGDLVLPREAEKDIGEEWSRVLGDLSELPRRDGRRVLQGQGHSTCKGTGACCQDTAPSFRVTSHSDQSSS